MQALAIVLEKRPSGQLDASEFRQERISLPELADGQVLVSTRYLSIDPYQRGLLDEAPFVGQPIPIGGVIAGRGIGEVVDSKVQAFRRGDLVFGDLGWQSASIHAAKSLRPIAQNRHPVTWQLGVLGIPGITAWLALQRIAAPKTGETIVVSSAAGTVGAAAGQIAKAAGCRVVGLARGARKVALLRAALGFDDAIDYRASPDLAKAVGALLPDGVDIYFDNVGGPMLDSIIANMKPLGRIVVCGAMSSYEGAPEQPVLRNHKLISFRRLRVEGFSVRDHMTEHAAAIQKLNALADDNKLRQIETICNGLSEAPAALVGLMRGTMAGKVIVACRPS